VRPRRQARSLLFDPGVLKVPDAEPVGRRGDQGV
jgi:hypothetical protein